jgi:hypothetical protein
MKKDKNDWVKDTGKLIIVMKAIENAYATFVLSDRFPIKNTYFLKRHLELKHFAQIIDEELDLFTYSKPENTILENKPSLMWFEQILLEEPLSDLEVDCLIMNKELELLAMYQAVLSNKMLPNGFKTIIQSQTEELNNLLQTLKLEYRIMERNKVSKT